MSKIQVSVSEIGNKMNILLVTLGKTNLWYLFNIIFDINSNFSVHQIVLFSGLCGAAPIDNAPDTSGNTTQLPGLVQYIQNTFIVFHTAGE